MKDAIAVIGDVHGLFEEMEKVIEMIAYIAAENEQRIVKIVQAGDWGYYPNAPAHYEIKAPEPVALKDVPRYWIRGNHEDHYLLSQHYHKDAPLKLYGSGDWQYVPDCIIHEGVLYVGGAWSIDRRNRNYPEHPFRWHSNEQIDDKHEAKLYEIMQNPDLLNTVKMVVTHDHPMSLYTKVVPSLIEGADYRTPRTLDRLVQYINRYCDHEVKWFAGHLGKSHMKRSATRFGTPLQFDLGLVKFFSLDMIVGFGALANECDAFSIVEI
jgi:hypothetical protein